MKIGEGTHAVFLALKNGTVNTNNNRKRGCIFSFINYKTPYGFPNRGKGFAGHENIADYD